MKKLILATFILFLASARTLTAQNGNSQGEITIGNLFDMHSKILGENRNIWVHVPNGWNPETNELERFPVLYLLDGNGHFFSTMGIMFHLSQLLRNTPIPKMIIVGIPNTNRNRDLTPTNAQYPPYLDSAAAAQTGGGEKFMDFIQKELIPHIDSLYPTIPHRTLIGHSFGGLTVINTLLNRPELFNNYIAIDPSLAWDNELMLKKAQKVLATKDLSNTRLFIGRANTMDPKINPYIEPNEVPAGIAHHKAIKDFVAYLAKEKKSGLKFKYKYYEEETHGSAPLPCTYDGLKFLFDYYRFNDIDRISDPKFNGDSAITAHYKNISKQMGCTVFPPEPVLNDIGYSFITSKHYDKAYALLKMNIDNHPKSFNCYDSMGDLYAAKGDKKKAIEYYQKTLALKEWPDTRQKLNKLLAEK